MIRLFAAILKYQQGKIRSQSMIRLFAAILKYQQGKIRSQSMMRLFAAILKYQQGKILSHLTKVSKTSLTHLARDPKLP